MEEFELLDTLPCARKEWLCRHHPVDRCQAVIIEGEYPPKIQLEALDRVPEDADRRLYRLGLGINETRGISQASAYSRSSASLGPRCNYEFSRRLDYFKENYNPRQHGEKIHVFARFGETLLKLRYLDGNRLSYTVRDFYRKFSERGKFVSQPLLAEKYTSLEDILQKQGYTKTEELPELCKLTFNTPVRDIRVSTHIFLDENLAFLKFCNSKTVWSKVFCIRPGQHGKFDVRFDMETCTFVDRDTTDECVRPLKSAQIVKRDPTARGNIRVTPQFSAAVRFARFKKTKHFCYSTRHSQSEKKYNFAVSLDKVKELYGDINKSGEFSEMNEVTELSVIPWPTDNLPDFKDRRDSDIFVREWQEFCFELVHKITTCL